MRLDHLLSKEKSRGCLYCLVFDIERFKISGADTSAGHTRSHPEHDS